jgi:NAD(P)H-nitrite reductase large subunit
MKVVVVGSGIAGITFAEKYRSLATEDITVITYEHDGYYSRPLLSRGFTKHDIEQTIVLKDFDKLRETGIQIISGTEVTHIDKTHKRLNLAGTSQEKSLSYDKLVLAQGSAAFVPPPFLPYQDLFFSLNSLTDLKALRQRRQQLLNQNRKPHWAVVGGGLIGCELASDLAVAGDDVTVFHALDRLMERQLVLEDSVLLLTVLQESGVHVLFNQNVHAFSQQQDKFYVHTESLAEFDGIVVACGFKPRTQLAQQAGLKVGRGIKVNPFLQANDEDIFALGDAAELPDGKVYAYILPIRNQANWLANFMAGQTQEPWQVPHFTSKAKVHHFEAQHPYQF